MPPVNRLTTQGNGRLRAPELPQAREVPSAGPTANVAAEIKSFLRRRPGTVLIIGLVTGGILGWLTSKRR